MAYTAKVDGTWVDKAAPGGTATSNLIDDGDCNRWETNQLDAHTRLTTIEAAYTNVSVDGGHASTLAIVSTAVTAADVGAVPSTGGTVSGDVRIQDSGNTKAYRFVTSGSGVPLYLEVGGENLVIQTNTGADFAGTARQYVRMSKDVQELQLAGEVQFRNTIGGTTVHDIDPSTGVAAIGAKNGLTNLRFCGFKSTTGAPTTGTWAVGDLVMDSAKVWWRCSVAGTPGTWV